MESAYNISKAASTELVESLLGVSFLNYVGHRACVRKASQSARISKRIAELSEPFKRQEQAGQQEKNRLHRATRNGTSLRAVPHRLNGTELSWEKFRDNLRLRYGLMPQDIPATCDGCGDVLWHQPISEVKIIPEFLLRQLHAIKAMRYSAKPCPIPRCQMEAVFLLASCQLLPFKYLG